MSGRNPDYSDGNKGTPELSRLKTNHDERPQAKALDRKEANATTTTNQINA